MAKEPLKPNDKTRLAMNLSDANKQLIDLFGGDKKHFEPIEDDEDDLVQKAPVTEPSPAKSSLTSSDNNDSKIQASSTEKIAVNSPPASSRDTLSTASDTAVPAGEPTSDIPPSKPAKGIKSHWANLAAALGLRKKDSVDTSAAEAKQTNSKTASTKSKTNESAKAAPIATPPLAQPSVSAQADIPHDDFSESSADVPTEIPIDDEWPKANAPSQQISFDDLFANAPDLTESQVSPEAFLGASGLDEVDILDPVVNEITDDIDSDYVEFELAELDPVDRPQRIGRVDVPPPAADSADSDPRNPRRRRRRRRSKGDDKSAETASASDVGSDETVPNTSEIDPEPRRRETRTRSERSDSSPRKSSSERSPSERSSSERSSSERLPSERLPSERSRRDRDSKTEGSDRKPREQQSKSDRPGKPERSSAARERGPERVAAARVNESRSLEPRSSAKTKREADPIDSNGDDYIDYEGNPDLDLTDGAKGVTTWREAIDVIIDGNLSNRKRGGKPNGGGSRPPRNHQNDRRR